MLRDNQQFNESIKSNSAFLDVLHTYLHIFIYLYLYFYQYFQ